MLAGNCLCWHILQKLVEQACLSLFMHMACIMKSDARWSFCQFHNCGIIVELNGIITVIKTWLKMKDEDSVTVFIEIMISAKRKGSKNLTYIQNCDKYFCYYYIFIQVVKSESFHWHQRFLCFLSGDDIADESILVVKNKKWKYIFQDCHWLCRSQPLWET